MVLICLIATTAMFAADVNIEIRPNGDRVYHFHNGPETLVEGVSNCTGTAANCKDVVVGGGSLVGGSILPAGSIISVFGFSDGVTMAGTGRIKVILLETYDFNIGGPLHYQMGSNPQLYTNYAQWLSIASPN